MRVVKDKKKILSKSTRVGNALNNSPDKLEV